MMIEATSHGDKEMASLFFSVDATGCATQD